MNCRSRRATTKASRSVRSTASTASARPLVKPATTRPHRARRCARRSTYGMYRLASKARDIQSNEACKCAANSAVKCASDEGHVKMAMREGSYCVVFRSTLSAEYRQLLERLSASRAGCRGHRGCRSVLRVLLGGRIRRTLYSAAPNRTIRSRTYLQHGPADFGGDGGDRSKRSAKPDRISGAGGSDRRLNRQAMFSIGLYPGAYNARSYRCSPEDFHPASSDTRPQNNRWFPASTPPSLHCYASRSRSPRN